MLKTTVLLILITVMSSGILVCRASFDAIIVRVSSVGTTLASNIS